jgi:hypothetical protein
VGVPSHGQRTRLISHELSALLGYLPAPTCTTAAAFTEVGATRGWRKASIFYRSCQPSEVPCHPLATALQTRTQTCRSAPRAVGVAGQEHARSATGA